MLRRISALLQMVYSAEEMCIHVRENSLMLYRSGTHYRDPSTPRPRVVGMKVVSRRSAQDDRGLDLALQPKNDAS